jgi:hypothetical protein
MTTAGARSRQAPESLLSASHYGRPTGAAAPKSSRYTVLQLDDIVLDPAAENSRAVCRGTMHGSS